MDEIGDEFSDKPGNDKTGEELSELTNESDELNEFDDDIPETFSETDEFNDDIPETFSEPDEFDDDIPETFSEPDEFDDIIPERFSEPDEFDDIIPERFSETDEFDNILDDTIHDKEVGERVDEDQDSGDVGNVVENENIGPQSTSTVLTSEIEEIGSNMEHQEQEEEIEIRPEEYQDDTEPIVNTDEIEFIKDVEELAEHARELKAEDENVEPQAEQENAAYYAEQYYEKLKEKEVVNDQNSIEEQETEELRQEVTEELKGDQESGYKSDELEEEDASKKITSTEEFEYLWEIRDKLDREGKPPEEIEEVMHEAEEMYETLKNAEKLYKEQQQEKLKLVNHEDEASDEDLKENLDRVDLVEQAVEIEHDMIQQGKSQEEIDTRVEEAIETTKFEEKLEKIIEKQELEKLKLVDHEDEEDIDDAREEIDRPAEAEYYMEVEVELHRQGMSQEEIDEQMEEIASNYQNEINKKQEKEEETNVNEKLEKHDLETNEQNSSAEQCDQIELTSALSSGKKEESNEEENERLQELYLRETGRRPIYSSKKTKGYSQWLEQRELGAEKVKNSKSESEKKKEIDEEDWKAALNQWIKEASEEECNAEFISKLKKALESYNEFEDLNRKYLELYEKAQKEKLSEKEKNRLKSLTDRLQELDPIQFELLLSVFFIKKYITEQYWDDFWNKPLVNRLLSKFFKHISQKIIKLKKAQENKENSEEIIRNWIEQASEGEISPELKVKLKEIVDNKENLEALKLELDAIEIESEDKKDLLEEITKLGSEESDEEDWKTTLKQWIKEASEEECNAELKSELKKALESYNEFEDLTRKFLELYEKSQYEKLTEKEKNRLKSLTERLQGLGPIQLELLANIRAFKDYFNNQYWYDFWNKPLVNRMFGKFFKHISQKYKELRKEQKSEQEEEIMQNNVLLKQTIKEVESIEEVENIPIEEKLELKIELEEYKDYQQELEDALEEYRKIEVRASVEFKKLEEELTENENENEENSKETSEEEEYERVKQIYRRQTGRRPIYKGEQTKGFGKWLEERNELENELIDPKQQKINITPINAEEIQDANEKRSMLKLGDFISKNSKLTQKEKQCFMVDYNPSLNDFNKIKPTNKKCFSLKFLPSGSQWDDLVELLIENIRNENLTKNTIKDYLFMENLVKNGNIYRTSGDLVRRIKGVQVLANIIMELCDFDKKISKKKIMERFNISYPALERLIEFLKQTYKYNPSAKLLDAYGTSCSERNNLIQQRDLLQEFLDSKKKFINQKLFLPSIKNILSEVPSLNKYSSLSQNRSRWIQENTLYKNYTDLKEAFEGIPQHKKLRLFLDSKRKEILDGALIPSTDKIRKLKPEFNSYNELHHIIRVWLKNNTPFENIEQLKRKFLPKSNFPELVRKFLESKKNEILNGDFIPNKKSIIVLRPDLSEYENLMSTVLRWLRKNTPYENITDLYRDIKGLPIRDQIRNFLDSKKNEILKGEFIPTSKNLRKVKRLFGNYKNSHIVVAEWLKQNSIFDDLSCLIEYFNPPKSDLGLSGRHGYTPNFEDMSFRIENALSQIVRLSNRKLLEICKNPSSIRSMESLFAFLERNSSWSFVDILTGEVLTRIDYDNGFIAFHHIDRDKSNEHLDNLVFLLNTTHGIITMAQRFDEELENFFRKILAENVFLLKKGIIPESWKRGWESIALDRGIEIDTSRFERLRTNETIFDRESKIRRLDKWF